MSEHEDHLNKYFEFVKSLGYKIIKNMTYYPEDNDLNGNIRQVRLFCTKKNKDGELIYYFFVGADYSPYSLETFVDYTIHRHHLREYAKAINNRMVPFTLNEVIIGLLRSGYDIDEVYVQDNGKYKRKLLLSREKLERLFYWSNYKPDVKVQKKR